MAAGFTMLLAKLAALAAWFGDLFVAVFKALWDLIKDAFSWVFESVLDVVLTAINSLDLSGLNAAGGWGSIPSDIMNILAVLGVGEAVAIITAAIVIRFLLQLIPFVRLGS